MKSIQNVHLNDKERFSGKLTGLFKDCHRHFIFPTKSAGQLMNENFKSCPVNRWRRRGDNTGPTTVYISVVVQKVDSRISKLRIYRLDVFISVKTTEIR